MRILFLMQWFDPEPQIKGLAFAKKLRDLGHDVEILTGFPNYPGGKVYPGYAIRLFQREVMDGIRVLRVPLYPSHDASGFRRLLNYMSFGFTSCLTGLLIVNRKDVIYACGPPVTVGVSAAVISVVKRVPFVYDIQDLWPDSLSSTGMFHNAHGLGVVARVCQWVYRRAAHLTVQSPGVKTRLVTRGVAADRIAVIFNWCDETSIDRRLHWQESPSKDERGEQVKASFDVLFAGNMGKAQEMAAVLAAARILQSEAPTISLQLLGGGIEVPRLKAIVADQRMTNVTFLPRVPMSEVGGVLARADALLVHLKDDPLFKLTIPAKTQAYMAAGKPIVMAVAGDATALVLESGGGVCAQPADARSIADAIRQLAAMAPADLCQMGEKGRAFYWNRMALDVGAREFMAIFQRVCGAKEVDESSQP